MTESLKRFALIAFALAAPAFPRFAPAAQDLYCKCAEKRFDMPRACMQGCTCSPAVRCLIAPKCKGLENENFRLFYNRAVFKLGDLGPLGPPANTTLIAHIINYWYAPNNITQFNVTWEKPGDTADWARVEPASSGAQKHMLMVAPDALWLSPAYLVSVIGHEMIHLEQLKRSYTVRMNGLNGVLTSFRELEASAWELGARNFKWTVGPSKWSTCITEQEKKSAELTLACRNWQVVKAIEDVRGGMRREQFMPALEKYMAQDPWIGQVWLKSHPDWRILVSGPAPEKCPNP